jgi:hypothetical protein
LSDHQEGGTVTITATGKVSQKTTSGYIVTIHGVDVPFVQIGVPTQELAQKILDMIEQAKQKTETARQRGWMGIIVDTLDHFIEEIEELCQEEVNKQ